MKGLILCAGKGTRLQPFTFTRPKCLVPVNGDPLISYIIRNMVNLGITDIGIVINDTQDIIKQTIGSGDNWGTSLTYITQQSAMGLADAVRSASSFIRESPFLLMLGDNLIEGNLDILVGALDSEEVIASILLSHVDNPSQYGVASIAHDQIVNLEEKPQNPQSDLAIVGAYVFRKEIWPAIDKLVPSARGEYEITDAIQLLISQGSRVAYSISASPFFDVGTYNGWLAANRYKMTEEPKSSGGKQLEFSSDVRIIPPVYCDPSAKVYQSVIGPYVYIGPDCIVNHCKIENSILTENVRLSHLNAADSIFGSHVHFSGPIGQSEPANFILGDKSWVKDTKNE